MQNGDMIPFNDLSRTPSAVMEQVNDAIARVLASGWFVMGPEHNALEAELSAYLDTNNTVLVGNGTDALELALAAVGVGSGDVVLSAANGGGYTTIATRLLGATLLYCDVSPETLLMTAETVRRALETATTKPRAIVVTHLFGAMAEIEAIVALARKEGIAVVEDCAQSLGARLNGQHAGTFGDIATTSFYPTKNLGALGDGGAVYTNDSVLADRVRRMRQYGWESKYHIAFDHGMNSRMDELQAAILRAKLPMLDGLNERRRQIHARYEAAAPSMVLGKASPAFIAHLAVLRSDDREAARFSLREAGIGTDVHYPVPDHQQRFPTGAVTGVSLPVTELSVEQIFSIPMFPELTDAEVDRVVQVIGALEASRG